MSLSIDNENKRSLHKPAVMYARSACFITDDLACNDGEGGGESFYRWWRYLGVWRSCVKLYAPGMPRFIIASRLSSFRTSKIMKGDSCAC